MKRLIVTLIVLSTLGGSAFAYYRYRKTVPDPTVTTAAVTRGDIADSVGATGTLQAVNTVQVGSQVSGTILQLNADFNSIVKKGQVLARLDPSLFETQIEQARANLIRAQADLERLKVGLDDAHVKLNRAKELSSRQLIPQTDLDTADVNVRSIEAQIRSSQAQVTQAEASLNQNQVNMDHTVIEAPIDGLVISRDVDIGQTVAASMQAPILFVLAADLTKMQVLANLDESDVGRIRPGQQVRFRVDAYPAEDFTGTVAQVRLQPQIVQNVVTYSTVIDVPNPQLKLKPGMTANVNIEIARRTDVIRVPNAALRFRPTNEIFAALNQTPPEPGGAPGDGPRRAGRGAAPDSAAAASATPSPAASATPPASAAAAPSVAAQAAPTRTGRGNAEGAPVERRASANGGQQAAAATGSGADQAADDGAGRSGRGFGGGGGRGFGGRGGDPAQMMERLQSMPPEQRERTLERMRARGFDPTAAAAASDVAAGRGQQQPPKQAAAPAAKKPEATTIDALFGPLPPVESAGRVWVYVDGKLQPSRVRLGITDGQATELLSGDLEVGAQLVTNVTTGTETRPAAAGAGNNPLFGQPAGRFPGGAGGFGGGGGGGGRGR